MDEVAVIQWLVTPGEKNSQMGFSEKIGPVKNNNEWKLRYQRG